MNKSKYHDAFGAIVKITLRDGQVSDEEMTFLEHLKDTLEITPEENDHIRSHYLDYPIQAPYTYNVRLEHFYELVKVVNADDAMVGDHKTTWLERMATAMGFNPSNVKYITAKAIDLLNDGVDREAFIEGIRNLNS